MVFVQLLFIIFLLGFVFWLLSHLYSLILHAPYVNSSNQAIGEALKFSKLKKDEIFVDLGSGGGNTVILADKKYGANAFGLEISPFPYLLSKIKITVSGCQKSEIIYADFKKAGKLLKKADVVYLYLLDSILEKIEDWLFSSISTKTRVITLAFKFKKHKPIKIIETINLGRKTKIRMYKK